MRVTAWNTEAERLYGWKRDEVIGGVIQAAVRCSPSEPLRVILAKVHETGIWRGEFVRTTKSAETVVVRAKWNLRRDSDGQPLDIVETSRDITEVRRTEEALDQVRHQYQNLFQASVASFWELDFSKVGNMVLELQKSGVLDLREHFRDNPEYVRRLIRATPIVDVNEQSLSMFGNGKSRRASSCSRPVMAGRSLGVFADTVIASLEKKAHYSSEAVLLSLGGQRARHVVYRILSAPTLAFCPHLGRHRRRYSSKKAKAAQEKSERRYRDFFHFLPVSLLQLEGQEVLDIFSQARSEGVVDFSDYTKNRPEILDKILNGLKIVEVNVGP